MDSNAMALGTWPELDTQIRRGAGVILPVHKVIPAPADTIPQSGTLGNAMRASAQKGKAAWDDIVDQLITAIDAEAASGLQP